MKEYLDFSKNIAIYAGNIMKQYYNNFTFSYKEDNTVVTIVDKKINSYLIEQVKKKYKNHSVNGEEESFNNNSEYIWVCDPLDGTGMYVDHIPVFVFSLALVHNGNPIVGVIYDVTEDKMYYAIKGEGAYCNDIRIQVNDKKLGELGYRTNIEIFENNIIDEVALISELKNVYPLDEEAEYTEMSLSEDHRYLAVFSVKDGAYFVEMVDADTWSSKGPEKVFPASERMSYAWGEDGSIVMTNHQGYVAVISKTGSEENPYKVLFSQDVGDDFVQAFFDGEMPGKVHSASRYQCGVEQGLSVAENDGKAALVQNLPAGDDKSHIRNAALTCAVVCEEGILYRGNIKSNLVDLDYDMTEGEIEEVKEFLTAAEERESNAAAAQERRSGSPFSRYMFQAAKDFLSASVKGELGPHFAKYMIQPVRDENHVRWR